MAIFDPETNKFYCECGCGTQVHFYNRFVPGHNSRMPEAQERLVELGKLMGEYSRTPEATRKRRQSLQRVWDSLSPAEFWEKVNYTLLTEAAKETSRVAHRTPEARMRNSKRITAYWANLSSEEKAEKMKNRFRSAEPKQSPNGPERMSEKFLSQFFPGIFTPDWIERADIGGKHPDFWTKNGYKLIIESFGSHYHNPEYFDRLSEEELISYYKKLGWNCIVIWADSPEDVIYEWPDLARRINESLGSR